MLMGLRMTRRVLHAFAIVFLLPVIVHATVWSAKGWPASWRAADWTSAGVLVLPDKFPAATVRIYSARTGGWKGIFATHSWIVLKRKNADHYDRYDVVGWGTPVRKSSQPPDGRWYGNAPELVKAIDGPAAEALIPDVERAIADYRWSKRGQYSVWPGPNSNTFVAAILAEVPHIAASLPSTAVGRDFPANGAWLTRTGAGGWRLNAGGYLGLAVGDQMGVEIQILGLVAGIDLLPFGVKIPAFGRIGF
jgi:hypothetical protein